MLHVDLPTRNELTTLNAARGEACVSIYVPTTPLTQDVKASATELANLYKDAVAQLEAAGFDKRALAQMTEFVDDLRDDEDFWRLQANSLAVFLTPDQIRTYRLANNLSAMVKVSDRFHLTPLMRALTFDHSAFVLSLSENSVRLVEVSPDVAPAEIRISSLPANAASAVGKSTLNDRAPVGRIQGSEGQNVRLRQYARSVNAALRPGLSGRDTPLILAAADRMASIYRSVNTYPNLLDDHIATSNDHTGDDELAAKAREILDRRYRGEVTSLLETFAERAARGLATSDASDAARAATAGGIDTLLVDIDADLPGLVDDAGGVTFADGPSAGTYDVIDEIAGRALATGARILGVRKADLPDNAPLAAILRFAV
jgi:hypothetical protein